MSDIAYQNKDITLKLLTEALKHKSLGVYGLPNIRIKDARPTNLPAIEANELRLDNLFILEDDSLALIDYESTFSIDDIVKYVNYIARILKRFIGEHRGMPTLHLIVIFSADISQVKKEVLDIGCMKVFIEPAYLLGMDTEEIYFSLKEKVKQDGVLNGEELLELIVLPLTVKGKEAKQELVKNSIELAKCIRDERQMLQALSGIITFTDKIIDKEYAEYVKGVIMMTKVAQLIFDEGIEKGKSAGRAEGQAQMIYCIRRKYEKGYTAAAIADILEQKIDYVENICKLIEDNPGCTDTEIAKKYMGDGKTASN